MPDLCLTLPPEIALHHSQFYDLLAELGRFDVTGIVAQLVVALIAIGGSYVVQQYFENGRQRATNIDEAYRFNEAVALVGAWLEDITALIDQLVWPAYQTETAHHKEVVAAIQTGASSPLSSSFVTIPPFEMIGAETFVTKITHIGSDVELLQVVHRLRHSTRQFGYMCESRNVAISQLTMLRISEQHLETLEVRLQELTDITFKMLCSAEAVLDCASFLDRRMRSLAQQVRARLRAVGIGDVRVAELTDNKYHEKVRMDLFEFLNQYSHLKHRMLHMVAFDGSKPRAGK